LCLILFFFIFLRDIFMTTSFFLVHFQHIFILGWTIPLKRICVVTADCECSFRFVWKLRLFLSLRFRSCSLMRHHNLTALKSLSQSPGTQLRLGSHDYWPLFTNVQSTSPLFSISTGSFLSSGFEMISSKINVLFCFGLDLILTITAY